MSVTYLRHGRYSDGSFAACNNCGKEPSPTGCIVAQDRFEGVEVRIVTCDDCLLDAVRKTKKVSVD